MPLILPYQDTHPHIAADVFLAENATIIGDVKIGAGSSVWFQAVVRGDVDAIRIGSETNIQDACIVHCTTNRCPTLIGDRVTVGHRAILHGCTVESEVLIGMGAIVLDEAVVPSHTIIAAGALIPERVKLESGYLYGGIPARKIKPLDERHIEGILMGASGYVAKSRSYQGLSF